MIENILILCIGNICRSPMAAALLARELPDAEISTAGIDASPGMEADAIAIDLMRARGLDIASHRARRFQSWMGTKADLILTMDRWQCEFVRRKGLATSGRVYRLGDFEMPGFRSPSGFEVPDPYRLGRRAFENCLSLIERGTAGWGARIRSSFRGRAPSGRGAAVALDEIARGHS